jgi:formate dehydrogenase assembly factor FdhD
MTEVHVHGAIATVRSPDGEDEALEEVAVASAVASPGPVLERALLADLPERLRQPTFARTGGLHATGLFTPEGELVCVREDVGRHNAMVAGFARGGRVNVYTGAERVR